MKLIMPENPGSQYLFRLR